MSSPSPAPFFTVVIPTFNRAELVVAAVDSVLAQQFTDFELIVVDDGSTDDTVAMLNARYGSRIAILQQQNKGPGAARNFAARNARGKYIAFLDSDDFWFPWTLQSYRGAIEQAGEPTMLFAHPMHFWQECELSQMTSAPVESRIYDDYLQAYAEDFYRGSGVMAVRTDAMLSCGGFVEQAVYAEDTEFCLRLCTSPGVVSIRKPAMVAVRRHAGGSLNDLSRTFLGTVYLINREKSGAFPGGKSRRRQRLIVISRHVTLISLLCLERRNFGYAFRLYARIFTMQLELRKFKYLASFPIVALLPRLNPMHGFVRN